MGVNVILCFLHLQFKTLLTSKYGEYVDQSRDTWNTRSHAYYASNRLVLVDSTSTSYYTTADYRFDNSDVDASEVDASEVDD